MRSIRLAIVLMLGAIAVLHNTDASARRDDTPSGYRPHRTVTSTTSLDVAPDPGTLQSGAHRSTTWLASYTFDTGYTCVNDGWTSVDLTAQLGDFWHVDDFVDMGPDYMGRIGVLSGSRSLWCGARVSSENPFCGYVSLPGYGNQWNQAFCTTACVPTGPGAEIQFEADWDSEGGYDWTILEVTRCSGSVSDDEWTTLAGGYNDWDGNLDHFSTNGDTLIHIDIPDSLHGASGEDALRIRIHFFSDGSWSDEDGRWDTDGAFVLDDLVLTGLPVETFEAEPVGATETLSGNWGACTTPGYGDLAALYPGNELLMEDPCTSNLSCVWAFISGSTATYACGGHPGQITVPYGNTRGQWIDNEIVSPEIPLTGSGVRFEFAFDVYRDLHLDALVFYVWHVRSIIDGCTGVWMDRNFVYFGQEKEWLRWVEPVGDLVEPGASHLQVALGAVDMCPYWCGVYGEGKCHSHAPLFDNVEVYRIDSQGPQWSVRDIDLFQDTFAADGTTTGTARIDAAIDIMSSRNTAIRPGDSTVVRVSDPDYGLALDGSGWAAVYCYVRVAGPSASGLTGAALSQDSFRWPYVGSIVDVGGDTWYLLRMDTSFTDSDARAGVQPGAFCIDLNDSFFVPGDTVFFAFGATSAGPGNPVTWWAPTTGTTADQAAALEYSDECTILPAAAIHGGDPVLYVDGMNARGAQVFFDQAFASSGFWDVDRYDIRGPSSNVGNRPGARVVDPLQQLLPYYEVIVWSTGDLHDGLIGNGTTNIEKSNDAFMLLTFLDNLEVPGGIFFSGDNIAEEWQFYTGSAIPLRDTYIQHTLVSENHMSFFPISPLVIGEDGGCFDHITGPDTMVAYGGCPSLSDFDVLAPTGLSTQEMRYVGGSPGSNGAVISQYTLNPDSVRVGVILSGFAFEAIRDDQPRWWMDRWHHMSDVMLWLGQSWRDVLPSTPVYATTLAQNYPNPFNPTTTIEFTVGEPARVSVTIYNVRGQRVKTLVDGRFAPGVSHRVTWDGRNGAGQKVASGVYFYRMVTRDFTKTRKMVLLK